ncbi:hypothetical protein, partial [Vagococcus fluvialis]|uniref:hypothetical protein n=1 Tax=Vagococcus fluvialis TaxID=2738 RepID=UPI0037A70EEA
FFIYFGNFIKNNDKIQKNKPITLYEQPVCLQSETITSKLTIIVFFVSPFLTRNTKVIFFINSVVESGGMW